MIIFEDGENREFKISGTTADFIKLSNALNKAAKTNANGIEYTSNYPGKIIKLICTTDKSKYPSGEAPSYGDVVRYSTGFLWLVVDVCGDQKIHIRTEAATNDGPSWQKEEVFASEVVLVARSVVNSNA
jgi:hypothetical protein